MEQIRESEKSLAAGESITSLAEIQAQLDRLPRCGTGRAADRLTVLPGVRE
jgi:hypothetical protein